MIRGDDSKIIEVVHSVCCGLDVHKDSISACLIFFDDHGRERIEVQAFGTLTGDIMRLRDWLLDHECPVAAMESTGIYWRPVHNILEGFVQVILVNARDVKNVPGRKTDIGDSKWLAGLLKHGLLKGSFIPPKEVRQWRDLTRLRRRYVQTAADYRRRTQKLFESANIKIDSVISDLFGVSGRNLMNLLVSGKEITLSDVRGCMKGKLKASEAEIYRSIQGFFNDHHRFQLSLLLGTIQHLSEEIGIIDSRIRDLMMPQQDILERMKKVPGISEIASRDILAEVGPTLEAFATDAALSSWSGLCPGNNESAGKRRSGRSPVFKHHLKTIMIEVAWAAVRTKGSYYKDKYHRLKSRIGAKKAIVAIAHRIMKAIYRIIKDGAVFKDLGEEYLMLRNKSKKINHLKKQAQLLGFTLVPQTT